MGKLEPERFFDLASAVLSAAGREGLVPGSAARSVIEIRPDERVLQIVAGPGSGKTEVLVWRVLYELFVLNTPASRVLATTFTRRAATELALRLVERSDALIQRARDEGIDVADPHVHDVRSGTLHSLCNALLAEFDPEFMQAGTRLIDEAETFVRFVRDRQYLDQFGRSNLTAGLVSAIELACLFRPPWAEDNWPRNMSELAAYISGVIAQHTETWIPRCGSTAAPNGVESLHGPADLTGALVELQRRWEEYLDGNAILDFATMQKRFLERQECVLGQIDHVLVDEFQDTNPIQFEIHTGWIRDSSTCRLTVVGDDDQSIYRFRGSDFACFMDLAPRCTELGVPFRLERLEENWRSTKTIVRFAEAFRARTVLARVGMEKSIRPAQSASQGVPVRLLEGPWADVCRTVAEEVVSLGAGRHPREGEDPAPTIGILMFSTSEKEFRSGTNPALDLRRILEDAGLRVYNPRNKTAARGNSPIAELLGLISYLIDPVVMAPAGRGGRSIQVFASMGEAAKASCAPTAPPRFNINQAHATFQKRVVRAGGGQIGAPSTEMRPILDYIDDLRTRLATATGAHEADPQTNQRPRLSVSGFVARLLSFDRYRNVGFTRDLFREALFTELLEAHIAPTRLSTRSLDAPLLPTLTRGKFVWPDQFWRFISVFGAFLDNADLDDAEVESFAEDAVSLLTFHQTKGLEFDHVYVALTGREAAPHSVLRTKLFSGQTPAYDVQNGQPATTDVETLQLSEADREREIYVPITRPKLALTILHDPADDRPFTSLNSGIAALMGAPGAPSAAGVTVREFAG